jgi:hypothetical protein
VKSGPSSLAATVNEQPDDALACTHVQRHCQLRQKGTSRWRQTGWACAKSHHRKRLDG